MESPKIINFQSLTQGVGRFNFKDKTCLIPQMNWIGCHLLAAVFRGYGIKTRVMETCKGLDLGKEYTSGKECYPCQITTGDILYAMKEEKERLGQAFNAESYIYFMPEADGPCRFGMYNKYQRIILDRFPELQKLKIGALSTNDGYSLAGIIDDSRVRDLRKTSYFSLVVGDILDRLLWRIRPYESTAGAADAFIEKATHHMGDAFERFGPDKDFDGILRELDGVIHEGKGIVDPEIPPKPFIGIVGEIYLRTHVQANQDVIRVLERYGAEVVNASICEWANYTSYDRLREAKARLRLCLRQFRLGHMKEILREIAGYAGDFYYQKFRQKKTYKHIASLIDLPEDHDIGHLEAILKEKDLFSFEVGTEACLSISGIVSYAREGYNGVVNVYPFTCMPSTITSAIVKPIMNDLGVPYLDTPYDSSVQPGREAAIRTFMYQAEQHFKRHGRKRQM
ncbi:MAG: CoA activase [Deltaproteobacteria bacterium]|nr:CoA activase [Deltaproteobacteria bacterium]